MGQKQKIAWLYPNSVWKVSKALLWNLVNVSVTKIVLFENSSATNIELEVSQWKDVIDDVPIQTNGDKCLCYVHIETLVQFSCQRLNNFIKSLIEIVCRWVSGSVIAFNWAVGYASEEDSWTISYLFLCRHGAHNWEGPGALTALTALKQLSMLTSQNEWIKQQQSSPNFAVIAGK